MGGLQVDESASDLNKIYLEFDDGVPGNDQSGGARRDSSAGSNRKDGSNDSFRSRASSNMKRSNTRLGVGHKSQVPAPQCVQVYVDILQKIYSQPST